MGTKEEEKNLLLERRSSVGVEDPRSTFLSRVVHFVRVCELAELGTINLTPSYADNRTAVSLDIEEYSEVFFVSGYRRSNSENREKKFLFLFVLSLPPFCLCEKEGERETVARGTFISSRLWRLAINPGVISIKYLP